MRILTVSNSPDYQLSVEETEPPVVAGHDVVVRVAAAGVNRADLLQAEGSYDPPKGVPDTLGLEISGEIIEIGEKVRAHAVGDTVCALLQGGGYAEYVAVPEWRVLPVPQGMDVVMAAAVPEVYATAYYNLFVLGWLEPGETLLIQGGSSGVGMAAVQLARAMGARVAVTVGNETKAEACKDWGAELSIQYNNEDFVAAVKSWADNKGVDVILDMVGGDYFQRNMQALAYKGRLLNIAFLQGAKASLNMAPLLMKNLSWTGSTLRSQPEDVIHDLMQSMRTVVWPLFERGAIMPVIDSTYPFVEAMQAHARMRSSEHIGKILITFTSILSS